MDYNKRFKNVTCGIYEIVNTVNNKKYIGRSVCIEARWYEHIWELNNGIHKNTHLQAAWNKYGENNFKFNVIETCAKDKLNEREIYYIALYNTTNGNYGYNWTGGGDGEIESNEELRKRKSEALKKHYQENPEKAKIRFMHVAETLRTNEKREMHRQIALKQFQNPEFYKRYREQRASKEFKDKISKATLGRKMPEEAKLKIGKTCGKPVMCVETGEVFYSAREATRHLPGHKNVNSIVDKPNKTACGYHFVHVKKEENAV